MLSVSVVASDLTVSGLRAVLPVAAHGDARYAAESILVHEFSELVVGTTRLVYAPARKKADSALSPRHARGDKAAATRAYCILDTNVAYSPTMTGAVSSRHEGHMRVALRSAGLPFALAALAACARAVQSPPNVTLADAQRPSSAPASAGLQRERPAMVACPWPATRSADTVAPDRDAPLPPVGVIDPPRLRIPDCAPPGWTSPVERKGFTPPALPADRPRPIVDDYLEYVVTAPPPEIVSRFRLDTAFYKKYADAGGYPILASARVSSTAVAIVRDQVNYMLGNRPDVRDTMIAHGGRIVVMSETEYTMDVPEQRRWIVPKYLDPRLTPQERARYYEPGGLGSMTPEGYWNPRARGMGGTLTTCAEENVLGYYGTRYWGTNICVHEFSHAIMGAGIGNADPKWFQQIVDSYKHAKAACLRTANGYAGNTFNEYWAGGVEWYVGNGGRDRASLKIEDSTLYAVVSRLIPENKPLPVRANVANRTRAEMERYVREHNPEWWSREQPRQADASRRLATRGDSTRRAGAPATTQEPCVPQSSSTNAPTAENITTPWIREPIE